MQIDKFIIPEGTKVVTQTIFIPEGLHTFAAQMKFRDRKRRLGERITSKDVYLCLLSHGLEIVEQGRLGPADLDILCDLSEHNQGVGCNMAIPAQIQERAVVLMAELNKIEGVHIPFLLDFFISLMKIAQQSFNRHEAPAHA